MPKERKRVVEGAVGRIEQPQPGQRAHRRRDHPRHQQHAAPFALSLGRNVVDEVGDDEADQRLEDHRRDREDAGLLDHQPEGFALEQELEIAEADEVLHRLVQGRQMQRIERRIDHQDADQQDQRQRHQKRRGRLALERGAQTGALARRARCGDAVRLKCDINHGASSSRVACRAQRSRNFRRSRRAGPAPDASRRRTVTHAAAIRDVSSACSLRTRLRPRPASSSIVSP